MRSTTGFIFCLFVLKGLAQSDTMVWDAARLTMVNQHYPDGYHLFKKQGITVREFRLLNGKTKGPVIFYFDNGNPRQISETRQSYTSYFYGPYTEFYESGKIKLSGHYDYADSIACMNCYDLNEEKIRTKAYSHSARTGLWKEFFENGVLSSVGAYKAIHETYYLHHPPPMNRDGVGVFTPGDYQEDYLKDGAWQYYNETGCLVKEEFYVNGMLASVEEYSY